MEYVTYQSVIWFISIYKQVTGHQTMTSKDTGCAQQVNDFVATLLNKTYQDKNATELNMLSIKVCSSCCFGFHSLHPHCLTLCRP